MLTIKSNEIHCLCACPIAELSLIVCEPKKVEIVLEQKANCPNLKIIVVIGDLVDGLSDKGREAGVEIVTFADVEVCIEIAMINSGIQLLTVLSSLVGCW